VQRERPGEVAKRLQRFAMKGEKREEKSHAKTQRRKG
jgi:hypothetical protein